MSRRSGKTYLVVIGVVVLVLCLGCIGSLALVVLGVMNEADNLVKCKMNLQQLAVGVQNHQDQRGDVPPMGMFSGGVSWSGLILPYVEQRTTWERLRLDRRYDQAPNAGVLDRPDAAFGFFNCPSRRNAPQFTDGFVAGDYAVPSVGANPVLDDPSLSDTWMVCEKLRQNLGPMLLLYREPPEEWKGGDGDLARKYRSKTSIASWTDGTSNQVVFGEKALHADSLNKPGKSGDFTCYSFIENNFNASGPSRPGNGGVVAYAELQADESYRFWGSWHPGICFFAFGDGRVQPLNNGVSSDVVAKLCNRQDGERISIDGLYGDAK